MSSGLSPGPVLSAFEALRDAGVEYVVLRGYLPMGDLEASADIDVFVRPGDLPRAAAALRRAGWLPRALQLGRIPHFFSDFLGPGRPFIRVFDMVAGLNYGWDAHELVAPERVLARAVRTGGIMVPDPWHALFLLALHLLLDKEHLEPHHPDRIRAHREAAAKTSSGALVEDFGQTALDFTHRILEALESGNPSAVAALRREVRASPLLRARPWAAARQRISARVRQRFVRTLRIALVGMDGSGKSTLIEALTRRSRVLPVGTAYLGYNDFGTAWFTRLVRRVNVLASNPSTADSLRLRILDAVRAIMLPVDTRVRMWRAEKGKVMVIYDRFPLPGLEVPASTRGLGRLVGAAVSLAERLIPHPDVVFLLHGDPETLWARKQEYPLEVFQRGQDWLRAVVEGLEGEKYLIATDCAAEQSLDEIQSRLSESAAVRRILYR